MSTSTSSEQVSSVNGEYIVRSWKWDEFLSVWFCNIIIKVCYLENRESLSSNKSSGYSNETLACHRHACARCGSCRDWYWNPDNSEGGKVYIKRDDAACIGTSFYLRDLFANGHGRYYHRPNEGYTFNSCPRLLNPGPPFLCKCNNNRL